MLKLISLNKNLIKEVAEKILALGENKDYSNIKVIFPNKRMGIFLRDYLSKKIKTSYFPPEIFTMDSFVSALFDIYFKGYRRINNIEASSYIYKLFISLDNDYLLKTNKYTFLKFFPWGLKLFKVIEEILIESETDFNNLESENFNPEKFNFFVEYGEYHKGYKDFLKKLPLLTKNYVKTLEENKNSTRSFLYAKIIELLQNNDNIKFLFPDQKYIFAGFNALNRAERKIIEHFLKDDENSIMILRADKESLKIGEFPFKLQKEAIDNLNIKTFIEDDSELRWNNFKDKVILHPSKTIETEMFTVSNLLKEIISKNGYDKIEKIDKLKEIGIILPDSSNLIPFVHNVVSRINDENKKIPFNITLGYPFSRTPIFQLINYILELSLSATKRGYLSKSYLSLIRHPYIKLIKDEKEDDEPLKTAIHFIENLIAEDNLIYVKLNDLEDRINKEDKYFKTDEIKQKALKDIKTIHKIFVMEQVNGFREICEFLKNSISSISVWKGNTYLFLPQYKATFLNTIDEIINFSERFPDEFKNNELKESSEFIKYYFSQKKINFLGSPLKGIQVMGLMEFSGLKFKHLIILDNTEGILPQTFKYDPLLPYDIRKLFGLRTYKDYESLFGYNYFSLIAGAEKVHLLWSEKNIKGDSGEKSRFIERILYENDKSGKETPLIRTSFEFKNYKKEPKKIKKDNETKNLLNKIIFSPSSIKTYLDCPIKFYYENILKLKEKPEVEIEPDAGIFGTIVHNTLKELYNPFLNRILNTTIISKITSNLESVLEKQFKKKGFSPDSGIIKLRYWAVLLKLYEFLKTEEDRIKSGSIKLLHIETKIYKKIKFGKYSINIKGFVDRINNENGIIKILDYKTGKSLNNNVDDSILNFKCESLIDINDENLYLKELDLISDTYKSLQILLYIVVYGIEYKIDYKNFEGAYIYLKDENIKYSEVFKKKKGDNLSDDEKLLFINNFKSTLGAVFEDIRNREYFIPNPSSAKCSYCPFKNICGYNT